MDYTPYVHPERIILQTIFVQGRNGKYRCPCCQHFTLDERISYEICPVCFWEDDGQDDPYADEVWGGPNYELSLTAARENYQSFGAASVWMRHAVRPPHEDEISAAK